jgi:hypothetical protein
VGGIRGLHAPRFVSKEDTGTVRAFFHNMRACALGDPILVASIIRAIEECFPTLGQAFNPCDSNSF